MHSHRTACFLFALLLASPMAAQITHLRFARYGTRDGMADRFAHTVLQDPTGYLWVGSENGLQRFDGTGFTVFRPQSNRKGSIPSPIASPLFAERDGSLWVSTAVGLCIYRPQPAAFERLPHNPNDPSSAPASVVWMGTDRQGRRWLTGNRGWSLYDSTTKRFTHYRFAPPETDFTARTRSQNCELMMEDSDGSFWIPSNYGLYRFDPATGYTERFLHNEAGRYRTEDNLFTSGYLDAARRVLWMGTWAGGMVSFDLRTRRFAQHLFYTADRGQGNRNIVTDLLPKSSDELWIASPDEGLGVFNIATKTFSFCRPAANQTDPVPATGACYLQRDREGNLWVSFTQGLYKLAARNNAFAWAPLPALRRSDAYHTVQAALNDAAAQKTYLGLSIGDALYAFDWKTKAYTKLFSGEKLEQNNTHTVGHLAQDRAGTVWAAGNKLYKVDGKQNRLVPVPVVNRLLNEAVYTTRLHTASDGWLLLTSKWNGLIRYNPQTGEVQHCTADAASPLRLRHNRIGDLAEVRPGVWLLVGGEVSPYLLNFNTDKTEDVKGAAELKNFVRLRTLQADGRGGWWLSSGGSGLAHLKLVDDSFQLKRFFTETVHPGNDASSILLDGETLWLGTRQGLLRFHPASGTTQLYTDADGLLDPDIDQALHKAPNGEIWIGREGGFVRLDPTKLKPAPPPVVVLRSFNVSGTEWNDSLLQNTKSLSLAHDENLLSVGFSALGFVSTTANRYAYKLEGMDAHWVDAGTRNNVTYAGLPPGRYTLRIKAANADGVWSATPYSLAITVRPPFWATWWFYALLAGAVALVIGALHRYRLRQMQARERLKASLQKQMAQIEMKALRAQMNPHFIFNCLNSINGFIATNEPKAATAYLAKFARLIRQILDNAQHDFIPLQAEISTLTLYLEMEKTRFENRFHYSLEIDEGLPVHAINIPSMLVQPYVENAIWHGLMHKAGTGELRLHFGQTTGGELEVIVEDNGIGRAAAAELHSKGALKDKSYGMQITASRIALLNRVHAAGASQTVEDLVDAEGLPAGTRVVLRLPNPQTP